ncbi:MAG: DUF4157 domain-containing protein [Nostoc sp.]|uniref:eCIS core domain-containing protein n=1 Tax=Nostoc sp. TaxID=1180 RepID=UPI002FF9FF1E
MREHVSRQKQTTTNFSIPSLKHPIRGFGLESSAISRQAVPEVQPLHKPLTHDISRIPLRNPQAKLSISQPGDKYEQEADSVAQQVMQTMAQPVNRQPIQPEALPEDEEELQMKPLDISTLQREALPEDEEELQMKSLDISTLQREVLPEDESELQMKSMVQRQAGMGAAPDLEASINQARGGGVAMADNIRQPMEQAFGADFSRVKVHTDGQSDQLNRSIQARAFTTGQDVFFRQGEYNPGSRGGQELLAHELTHVVQQNGDAVHQRVPTTRVQEQTIQRVPADLTVPQRVTLRRAFNRAIYLCDRVISANDLVLAPIVDRYGMRPVQSRLNAIKLDFRWIRQALLNINIDNVQYDDADNAFAYVYPNDPTRLYLGNAYFVASRTGEDSVAGTLIHEASHWSVVRGTNDHGYGDEIHELAFTLARNNADTIERIAESFI